MIKKTVFLLLIMWLCGEGVCTCVPVPSEITGSKQPVTEANRGADHVKPWVGLCLTPSDTEQLGFLLWRNVA